MPAHTRRTLLSSGLALSVSSLLRRPSWAAQSNNGVAGASMLWYDKPAETWEQALPIGNGRLGAMIFGQPEKERLQLNDITVWNGAPQPDADRKDAYKNLPELRRLLRRASTRRQSDSPTRTSTGRLPTRLPIRCSAI